VYRVIEVWGKASGRLHKLRIERIGHFVGIHVEGVEIHRAPGGLVRQAFHHLWRQVLEEVLEFIDFGGLAAHGELTRGYQHHLGTILASNGWGQRGFCSGGTRSEP
jgi:hypothetical protein